MEYHNTYGQLTSDQEHNYYVLDHQLALILCIDLDTNIAFLFSSLLTPLGIR